MNRCWAMVGGIWILGGVLFHSEEREQEMEAD